MNANLISLPQIIGYLALLIYVAGYAFKNDNTLKLVFSFSNLFWIAHYYLINAQTAALTTALITVRNLLSLRPETFSGRRKQITAAIFTILLLVAGTVTWAGWISLLPVTATILVTYAMLYLNGIRLRQLFLFVDMLWLVHAIVVVSFGGFLYAVLALAMNGYTIHKIQQEDARNAA